MARPKRLQLVAAEPKKNGAQPFVMVDARNRCRCRSRGRERSLEAASVMATTIAKDKVDAPVPVAASMPPQNGRSNPAQEQQAQQRGAARLPAVRATRASRSR